MDLWGDSVSKSGSVAAVHHQSTGLSGIQADKQFSF
jgi:hypothetical protein